LAPTITLVGATPCRVIVAAGGATLGGVAAGGAALPVESAAVVPLRSLSKHPDKANAIIANTLSLEGAAKTLVACMRSPGSQHAI
jgi:hypothetical protein